MTEPASAIRSLPDSYPDREFDPYFLRQNREAAAEQIATKVPRRYANATVTDPDVISWVNELIAGAVKSMRANVPNVIAGPSLFLLGPTGTGKTHQTYGAIRALAKSGVRCAWLFMTAADVYSALRPRPRFDMEGEFQSIATTPLLVVDDLGATKLTEWVEEINYRLINTRYERELATVLTSNLLPKDLTAYMGERVISRVTQMTARVTLKGADKRLSALPTLKPLGGGQSAVQAPVRGAAA